MSFGFEQSGVRAHGRRVYDGSVKRTQAIQKFRRGDLVAVAKSLGPGMSHFESGADALILGSYADRYPEMATGADDRRIYILLFAHNGCEVAWYDERHLKFVRHEGEEGIRRVRERREKRRTR